MCCNGQHRLVIAMAVEQTIDEVKIAGTTASRTNGQFAGDGCFCTRGKGCGFLVTDMHPVDFAKSSEAVIQSVEAVARNAPDTLNTRFCQGLSQKIRNSHAHDFYLSQS
ncbi:hypothetical protein D9M68_878290 [compost metagenome]